MVESACETECRFASSLDVEGGLVLDTTIEIENNDFTDDALLVQVEHNRENYDIES